MRVLTIFGTQPEAIKMAPVVRPLAAPPGMRPKGQKAEMQGLVKAAVGRAPLPSSFNEIVAMTRTTLAAADAALTASTVRISHLSERDK